MKHILTPPFLGSLRTPWSAGLTLHWHMALFILSAYLFLLAFYLLLGQNPTDMTVSFFGESFEAISPLLENTVGYWLLISYLHAAVAPLNFELHTGFGLIYVAMDALWVVILDVGLLLTWIFAALSHSHGCEQPCSEPDLLHEFPPQDCPVHLAVGWTPGTSPHVIYN